MANTMTLTSATHAVRPRTLAPWATSDYATAVTMTGVPFAGCSTGIAGVAGVRGTDVRDSVARQGAPPRENPR